MYIDIISTSRSDFDILASLADPFNSQNKLKARLILTGSHFSEDEKNKISDLRESISLSTELVPCKGIGKSIASSGHALSEMTSGFTRLWENKKPNLLVILGDRFEILPPVTVALLNGIPIAHMFGGECDVGHCLDTQVRDAVTKMAHIHFVSHDAYYQRLIGMGEEDWRILIMGNPAIDKPNFGSDPFLSYCRKNGWPTKKIIAACYLPSTTQRKLMLSELDALLGALDDWSDHTVIWTGVNADPGGGEIKARLEKHCSSYPNHHFVSGLGIQLYHSLLQCAEVMVGNSSSGILEAATYGLPVINVGVRQTGRLSGENVINVPGTIKDVQSALLHAILDEDFKRQAKEQGNPFHTGSAGECVVEGITDMLFNKGYDKLMLKRSISGNPNKLFGLKRVPEYLS